MSMGIIESSEYNKVAGSGVTPVDAVEEGNMNPVTSNAVAEALASVGGNAITFEDVPFSKTLNAQSQDFTSLTVPVKSGYTAKNVSIKKMEGTIDTISIICTAMFNVQTTNVIVIMHNYSGTSQTCTGSVSILYVKD